MTSVPNPGPPDPEHPLHRASYALETFKYGEAWREEPLPVTGETRETTNIWLARLLHRCGLDLDPEELNKALDYYALSFSKQLGIPILLARSLFFDGFTHGLALGAELDADPPSYYEP